MSGEKLSDVIMHKIQEPIWFFQKDKMTNPGCWQISRDIPGKAGAKQFASFDNYIDMIAYMNDNKNSSLYEILVNKTDACFMYFDIDLPMEDGKSQTNRIIKLFCTTLSLFLKTLPSKLDITWIPGTNCQIATASTDKKCSIHFVGYIHMTCVDFHKYFTELFITYIKTQNTMTDENNNIALTSDLLFFSKNQNNIDTIKCAIDVSVYTQYRSYRSLYMQKTGKTNKLRPYGTSSVHIADHLVNYYDTYSNTPIAKINDDRPLVDANINHKDNICLISKIQYDIPIQQNDNQNITIDLLRKVVMGLNKSRAKDRESWLQVMFGIATTAKANNYIDDGWELLEAFSLQEMTNYKSRENIRQYDAAISSIRKDTIGFGSLVHYLKEDNYDLYIDLFSQVECDDDINVEGIDKFIDVAVSGSHYDVAVVVKMLIGNQIKHIDDKVWYVWDSVSGLWKEDRGGKQIRIELSTTICSAFAKRIIYWNDRIRLDDENKDKYEARVKKLLVVCEKLKDNYYKNCIVRECEQMLNDSGFVELLDENTNIMGFNNGVYDFTTSTLRKGRPDDYITMSVGYDFPEIVSDDAIKSVMKVFNDPFGSKDVTTYVLQTLASCMDGRRKFQEYYIWTGRGSNGKSTIQELIMKCFGVYAKPLDIAFWTRSRREVGGAMPELADKKGVRFVFSNEPEATDRIQVAKIKEVTGGERITARKLYSHPITFRPQFGIFILCNDLPELSKIDGGIERRTRILPYCKQFKQNPIPGQLCADPMVLDNCRTNTEWHRACMRILLDTYATIRHASTLVIPVEISNASRTYMEENNPIGIWLRDNYEITTDENDRISADEMWTLYKNMVDRNISKTAFGTSMMNVNNINRKQIKINKINKNYYVGIKLLISIEDDE